MELHDYVSPEPDILRDDYEPRPKASQHVAAFHRAKASRPTHDTEPIQPIALPSIDAQVCALWHRRARADCADDRRGHLPASPH
jgi:hypothetical protein